MMEISRAMSAITVSAMLMNGVALVAPPALASTLPPAVSWAKQANPVPIGASTYFGAEAGGAVSDAAGNTYVAGSFLGSISIGGTTLEVQGDPEQNGAMYIAKFSPSGSVEWAKRYGGSTLYTFAEPAGIALDQSGNIHVSGIFFGTVEFGGGVTATTDPNGPQSIFTAKLDSSGTGLWASVATTVGGSLTPSGIAVTPSGRSVITGSFTGDATFGPETLTTPSSIASYVTSYSANGTLEWARAFATTAAGLDTDVSANSVGVDADGNAFVAGAFNTTADFAGIVKTTTRTVAAPYLARLAPNGSAMWVQDFSTATAGTSLAVTVDASGSPIVAGRFSGSMTLGTSTITGTDSCFIARLSPNSGLGQWGLTCGGGSFVALAAQGSAIYFAGSPGQASSMGGVPIVDAPPPSGNRNTTFIALLDTSGAVTWAQAVVASPNSLANARGIAPGAPGRPVIVGDFRGGWSLGGLTLDGPTAGAGTVTDTFFAGFAGAPSLSPATQTVTATTGTAITPTSVLTATNVQTPVSYAVSPSLPAGLSVAAATGVISGTPTAAQSATTYTITGTDAGGRTITATVSISVAAPGVTPATQTITATTGAAITPTQAYTATGFTAPLAYTVAPTLPAGLSIAAATGVISGTPTTQQSATTYTVTARDSSTPARTATATVSISVNSPGITPATQTVTAVTGQAMTPTQAYTATSLTAPLTYTVAPTLPAGLSIAAATGVISGTPTTQQSATTYTITVTDSSTPQRTATASVSIRINPPAVTRAGKVSSLKASAQRGKVIVRWQPPTDTGGGTVTAYEVRVGKRAWVTHSQLRYTVSALKKGQSVAIQVRAITEAGPGIVSTVRARAR